jgi:hypothetical protein
LLASPSAAAMPGCSMEMTTLKVTAAERMPFLVKKLCLEYTETSFVAG